MIPRLAALSIAETKVRISSALGDGVERACFCILRKRATTLRLRRVRVKVWRARFAADLVLAMLSLKPLSQSELGFLSLGSQSTSHSHLIDGRSAGALC